MTGGIQLEYSYNWDTNECESIRSLKESIKTLNIPINDVNIYKVTGKSQCVIEIGVQNNSSKTNYSPLITFITEFLQKENPSFTLQKYTLIGQAFWSYIQKTAILTLLLSLIGIGVYLMYAFKDMAIGISSWVFSLLTIVTLFHDVIITYGLYSITSILFPEFRIDTFFVTALLTIIGYSINDTIIIFDRIRRNIKTLIQKESNIAWIVENSLHQTFTRSVYTSFTLILVLISMLIFGPESIKWFTLALIFWTIVGTYSSICIAAPLLYEIYKNSNIKPLEEKKQIPPHKEVVLD